MPPELSETYRRYALGLADGRTLPRAPDAGPAARRAAGLLAGALGAGARGWPSRRTLYSRTIPPGCGPCLEGRGSNLCVTTLCDRSCAFCFNPKPRLDELVVHGRSAAEDEAPAILAERGAASVGLGGGEPLLFPDRVFRLLGSLRARFGSAMRIDLYTNGDRLNRNMARALARAGLDGVRINLEANGLDLSPVRAASGALKDVSVEIPALPGKAARLKALLGELEEAGAGHLILHELFFSAQNVDALERLGLRAKAAGAPGAAGAAPEGRPGASTGLTWSPVAGSEETALETLAAALSTGSAVSVYYCSTGTQEWISERARRAMPRMTELKPDGAPAPGGS